MPAATFFPIVLCKLVDAPPAGPAWLHEIKFDGYRMQLHVSRGRAAWFSRNGNDWTGRFPGFDRVAARLPDCVLDGELCAVDSEGRPDFSALRSALARNRTTGLVFFAFDILRRGRRDLREKSLADRKAELAAVLAGLGDDAGPLRAVRPLAEDPRKLIKAACDLGLEGIVSKRLDSGYRVGRTGVWTKTKCRPAVEVLIGGWKSEHGSRFKSLLTGRRRDDGALIYAGGVHTGFGHDAVRELMPRLKALAVDRSPFTEGGPRRGPDVHFVTPGLVAEVEMAEWTASGKLRQASYKGLRDDVDPAGVTVTPRR